MNKKELATLAIRYWQSVEAGEELEVLSKPNGLTSWVKLATFAGHPSFSCDYNYKLVAPCHAKLLLKYLNEGVEVECIGNVINVPMHGLTPQAQQDMWTDPHREIREKQEYKDDEVWWCYMGDVCRRHRALYYHTGGWYRSDDAAPLDLIHRYKGFKPLYKIGDLK